MAGSSDFDDLLSASAQSKGRLNAARQRRAVQIVDPTADTPKYLQTMGKATYASKPISVDDIRKAKRSKKLGAESSTGKEGSSAQLKSITTPEASIKSEPMAIDFKEEHDPIKIEKIEEKEEEEEERSPPRRRSPPESPPQQQDESAEGAERVKRRAYEETMSRMAKRKRDELEKQAAATEESQPKKKKKRVSWAGPDKLIKVIFFEKYLSSMNQHLNFQAQLDLEKQREKEFSELQRKKDEEEWNRRFDAMASTMEWRAPVALDLPPACQSPMGKNSKEVELQKEREGKVLGEIYVSINDIPPSPAEPQNSEGDYDDSDVPLIPFEEVVAPTYPPPMQHHPHHHQPMQQPLMPTAPPTASMAPALGAFAPQHTQQPQPGPVLDPLSSLSSLLQDPSMLSKLLEPLTGLPGLGGVAPMAGQQPTTPSPVPGGGSAMYNPAAYGQPPTATQQPPSASYMGGHPYAQPTATTATPTPVNTGANLYNPLQPTIPNTNTAPYDPKRPSGGYDHGRGGFGGRGYGDEGRRGYDDRMDVSAGPSGGGFVDRSSGGAPPPPYGGGGGGMPYDNRRDFPMTNNNNFPRNNNNPPPHHHHAQQRDFSQPPQQQQLGGVGGMGGGGMGGGGGMYDPAYPNNNNSNFQQQQFGGGPPPNYQGEGRGPGGPPPKKKAIPCKYFNTREGCRNGDNCPWYHEIGGGGGGGGDMMDTQGGGNRGGGGGGRGGWRGRR